MLRIWFGALAILALLVAGCASTPQASPERDSQARQFPTHPGASTIYLYRNEFDYHEDQAVLYIDGRLIGATLPGAYFRIDTVPAPHLLHGMGVDVGKLEVETRAGELYFVELSVSGGHSHFRLVPEEVGRRRILQCCVLLENWAPGQRPLLR
jgi:hypothetical protein